MQRSTQMLHALFMEQNVVALEDQHLRSIRKLNEKSEAFYSAYRTCRPRDSQVSIAEIAGKFFRFAHEMTEGDLVLYPATKEKRVYVGTIVVSSYRYDASVSTEYPHQRQVRIRLWFICKLGTLLSRRGWN